MTTSRKPLDAFAITVMLSLCLLWGLQQVAVKLAAPDMGPVLQMAVRSLLAAMLVWIFIRLSGNKFSMRDGTLWPGVGIGVLFALEFVCVGLGLEYTSASHMSVFIYTSPVFTVLGLHFLIPSERLGPAQWSGVLAAFAGIAIAFSGGFAGDARDWKDILLGDVFGLAAGLLWAALTVLIRCSALSEAPPAATLLYQLGGGGLILLPVAAMLGQATRFSMTGVVWGSLFFQAVLVAFISFLVWYWLMRRYLVSRLSAFSFLTPLFGVGFGVLLLQDPVGLSFAVGAVLVFAGVVMVNLRRN
jgi:drug/metabolite transporter (DMT)-like permease